MWETAADLTFREAREGAPADIMIGAQLEPEGWAFADVVYDRASPERIKPILRALVCLNPLRRWKVGFDGDLKAYDLRYTLAHEIGHAIGLDHPAAAGEIMGFRYEERFRTLQPGDVKGVVALYGKRGGRRVVTSEPGPRHELPPPLLPPASAGKPGPSPHARTEQRSCGHAHSGGSAFHSRSEKLGVKAWRCGTFRQLERCPTEARPIPAPDEGGHAKA